MDKILKQSFELGFSYTRSTGPVVGRFLGGLRGRCIFGVRGSDGRILVPPMEYDPVSAAALDEFVRVEECGVVVSWCWVAQPRRLHPWQEPFAWALIRLDGADTPILHAVTGVAEQDMRSGMRVQVRWSDEPRGDMLGIASFVAEDSAAAAHKAKNKVTPQQEEALTMMEAPIYLPYQFTAGSATAHFLRAIKEGRILGQRCADSDEVYVPPRGSSPKQGIATSVDVELPDTGVVRSFTVVHIPIPGNPIDPPFVVANILLDGAAVPFIHLVSEVPNEEVRIGMRVKAVWKPRDEWDYSLENIRYFKPLAEADVDIDRLYREHRDA